MSTQLKIKVNKEILRKSAFCGFGSAIQVGANCAIALVVQEVFPNAVIGNTTILFDSTLNLIYSTLPDSAIDFIKEFDKSTPEERVNMPEFEFTLDIPDEVISQVDISALVNHPTLKLV